MPDEFASVRGTENLKRRDAAVRRQRDLAVRKEKQAGLGKTVVIGLMGLGLCWSVYNMNLLATKAASRDTVYATLQADGEFVSSVHYSEIPTKAGQEQDVQNALWNYVMARDCYGSSSFIRQAYMAQAMSDQRVGTEVHNQFALINPQAPQHVYGEHGVTVQCDAVDPPTPIGDNNNQYVFRFRRWEEGERSRPGDIAKAPIYTVTVRYRTGIYPRDDARRAWLDRTTFNAPGVQVIEYPGAKPENAAPVPPTRLSYRMGTTTP